MHVIDTELQKLEALYDRLEIVLEQQYQHLRLSHLPAKIRQLHCQVHHVPPSRSTDTATAPTAS